MFNGIIKHKGKITFIKNIRSSLLIGVSSKLNVNKKMIGSSISCNGVCLTLTKYSKKILYFYLSRETINRSNFKNLKKGKIINLENSIKYGDEISGHYAQGHIDCTAKVKNIKIIDKTWIVKLFIQQKYLNFIVEKASIHINGVSLTVSKKAKNFFEVNIIPHTLSLTNLINLKVNDLVNIELDIFSKYIVDLDK